MGDKKIFVFVSLICLIGLASAWADDNTSAQNVDGCNTLNTTGASYTLTSNVNSTGTCFNITAQNITLDCNGSWINYSTGGGANTYGVVTNQFNTTIKNCNILDGNWASGQTTRYGIYFNGNDNSTLFNISVNVSESYGIWIYNSANFNNLTYINTFSNKSSSIGLQACGDNTISNLIAISNTGNGIYSALGMYNDYNNITARSNSAYGIHINNGAENTFNNTIVSSNGNKGLYLEGTAFSNNFSNLIASSNTSNAIHFSTASTLNYLYNTSASSNLGSGVSLSPSSYNIFDKLIAISNISAGISLSSSSDNIFSNVIVSSNSSYGMYISGGSNNNLFNINASSNTSDGLNLYSSSNNKFSNMSASSDTRYGIYMRSGSNNTFNNVNVSSNLGEYISFYPSSISECNNTFNNVYEKDGKAILYINGASSNIDNIDASMLIMCNSNSLNITNSNFTQGGISSYYSNSNTLDNVIANSISSYGIYLASSSSNTLNKVITSSNSGNGIYLSGSSNNHLSNVNASSNTSDGLNLYSSSNNNLSNVNAISNSGNGIYISESSNNNLSNVNANSNTAYGITLYSSTNNNWNNVSSISLYNDDLYFSFPDCSDVFNNVTGNEGKSILYIKENYLNITGIDGSMLILCNANFSNITSSNFTKGGISISYSNSNILSNINTKSNLSNALLLSESSNNIFNNINAISNLTGAISLQNSNENTLNNVQGITVSDDSFGPEGIRFDYSSNNILNNVSASSNKGMGFYITSESDFNTLSNVTVISNTTVYNFFNKVFKISSDSDSNLIINSTFISLSKNAPLVMVEGDNNTFYWNNFTETSEYYVLDYGESYYNTNYYNTTINGKGEGNIWNDVMNGSVDIKGNISSTLDSSLYIGEYGTRYPYNNTNSFGKISGNVVDYAPLTNQFEDSISPTYSSVAHSSTYAGHVASFSININDETALHPNGQYIFSTNNSGTWENDTAVNFTSTPSWANVSKTLNSNVGMVVGYMWYLNDDNGNVNSTSVYKLTTTQAPVVDPPSSGGGGSTAQVQTQYQLGREFSEQGESLKLRKNYQVGFKHREGSHTLTVNSFTTNTAKITIRSDPITATLEKDIAQSFNIDDEEGTDVEITYQGTSGSEAQFFIKKIIEVTGESEVFANSEGGEVQETNQISTDELFGTSGSGSESVDVAKEKTKRAKNPLRTVLISLIIMGAVIAGLYAIGKNEKKKKDHYLGFFDK